MTTKDEVRILKLAGVSYFDIMIETGRKAGESLINDIIYLADVFTAEKQKSPHLHKGDKTADVSYLGNVYTVVLNNWS